MVVFDLPPGPIILFIFPSSIILTYLIFKLIVMPHQNSIMLFNNPFII